MALTPLIEIGIHLITCIDEKSVLIPNYVSGTVTGLGYRASLLEQRVTNLLNV